MNECIHIFLLCMQMVLPSLGQALRYLSSRFLLPSYYHGCEWNLWCSKNI